MNVLLVNTYDLGRQPFGLASAAATIAAAGHDVRCVDLAVEPARPIALADVDALAIHVPMHTASRIALAVIERARGERPDLPIAAFGLYAPLAAEALRAAGASFLVGGEFEGRLAGWLEATGPGSDPTQDPAIVLERIPFRPPHRQHLPSLERYAHLIPADGGAPLPVASTEASRGCRHLCRHCPVVPVYRGRFRIVPEAVVLADIDAQIEAGARHVTFGDPDFLNGPGHALRVVRALAGRHPGVTYDVTVKVEHLLRHRRLLPELRETGCILLTSAFESFDDAVLARLGKGHDRADLVEAVRLLRDAGIALQPTFIAFHPWMDIHAYLDMLRAARELDLVDCVPPVQWTLRLLVPPGSLLLQLPELRDRLGPLDPARLVHPWSHDDPRVDALQLQLAAVLPGLERREAWERAWTEAHRAAEIPATTLPPLRARAAVPYLTEPWYC